MVSCPSFSVSVICASSFSIRFIETRPQRNIWSRKQGKIASATEEPRMETSALATLPDEHLLDIVQRQTFNFFWDGAHPVSGLAPDRCTTRANATDDKVA